MTIALMGAELHDFVPCALLSVRPKHLGSLSPGTVPVGSSAFPAHAALLSIVQGQSTRLYPQLS